jgi:hypothetical protein
MKVNFTVRLYNDSGYEETESLALPIGVTTLTDPIGPDDYGYMCYDDGDIGYINAPTYCWIEIDPLQGGYGTNTGLVDPGNEGDGLTYMELPFLFKFYGVTYNGISICSNGWISFGQTENMSFRNWPVPDAMGPSSMVAAFWEDLYTANGGVFTCYDADAHWFIIEWSECEAYSGEQTPSKLSSTIPRYIPPPPATETLKCSIKHSTTPTASIPTAARRVITARWAWKTRMGWWACNIPISTNIPRAPNPLPTKPPFCLHAHP